VGRITTRYQALHGLGQEADKAQALHAKGYTDVMVERVIVRGIPIGKTPRDRREIARLTADALACCLLEPQAEPYTWAGLLDELPVWWARPRVARGGLPVDHYIARASRREVTRGA